MRLARARALYEQRQFREALRLLDGIDIADPSRSDADRLRADVQRDLLATALPAVPRQAPPDAPPAPRAGSVSTADQERRTAFP
jgi:hypothetical protein